MNFVSWRNREAVYFLLTSMLLSQQAFSQQVPRPVFQADANLVPIEVQVLDGSTRQPIGGLSCEDFVVLDEASPAEITACDEGETPRDILLLLDASGGFNNEGIQFVGPAVLRILRREDRAALMSFSNRKAQLRTRLTNDEDELERGLLEIFVHDRENNRLAVKNSRLLDAVHSGVDFLSETSDLRRRLIIVVTHNRDKGSRVNETTVINSLLEFSIGLEAVTLPQERKGSSMRFGGMMNPTIGFPGARRRPAATPSPPSPDFLEDLHSVQPIVEATGGQVVHLDYANARRVPAGQPTGREWDIDEIAPIIEKDLLRRLRDQYVLAIRGASTPKRQFRRLEVRLTEDARRHHPNATIHARSGYFTEGARRGKEQ